MKIRNIKRLIKLIEGLPEGSEAGAFDMGWWTHSCGTPACIGGWACWLKRRKPDGKLYHNAEEADDVMEEAKEFIGVNADYDWVWDAGAVEGEPGGRESTEGLIATKETALYRLRKLLKQAEEEKIGF